MAGINVNFSTRDRMARIAKCVESEFFDCPDMDPADFIDAATIALNSFIESGDYDKLFSQIMKFKDRFRPEGERFSLAIFDRFITDEIISGAALYSGRLDDAIKYSPDRPVLRWIMTLHQTDIEKSISDYRLHAVQVLDFVQAWRGKEYALGAFAKSRREELESFLQDVLDRFHDDNGRNVVADFLHVFPENEAVDDAITKLIELSEGSCPTKDLSRFPGNEDIGELKNIELFKGFKLGRDLLITKPVKSHFFIGGKEFEEYSEVEKGSWIVVEEKWPEETLKKIKSYASYRFSPFRQSLAQSWFFKYVREAENLMRDQEGVPRVGEGWVNEISLFKFIQKSFPEHIVIHQGRPRWLGAQSLDIYFSRLNIGIEYQGDQHSRPVDFFGGHEAFEKQKERDLRKKRLCQENGCQLIEIFPDYDADEVLDKLSEAIKVKDPPNKNSLVDKA